METTIKAFLYSGFFVNSDEFSKVETSSAVSSRLVRDSQRPRLVLVADLCKPARTLARVQGSTLSQFEIWKAADLGCKLGVSRERRRNKAENEMLD